MHGKSFGFGEVLGFGWRVMKDNILFFVGVFIVSFLISLPGQILGNVMENYPEVIPPLLGYLLLPVALAIEIIVGIGLIKITLSFCDGQKPKFSTLFDAWGCFWKYVGAGILFNLIIAAPLVACLLPVVLLYAALGSAGFSMPVFIMVFILAFIVVAILSIKFSLWLYFVIDKGLGPINALRASSRTTMGVKWRLFVFGILCGLINLLGLLCFGIGIFATLPTIMVAMAFVYRQLSEQTPGLAEFGIGGPAAQPAPAIEPGLGVQLGLGIQLSTGVQPAPPTQPDPDVQPASAIQPETEKKKSNFLLPAVLGIIVIVALITYHFFWPAVKGTVASCKTVGSYRTLVSNKQSKLTGILYSDNPSAMVDSEIVKEGDTIDGAKAVKIHRDKVEFEKDNEKWTQWVHAMASHEHVKLTEIIYSDSPSAIVDGEVVKEGDTINGAKVVKIHRDKVEFEKDDEKWTQRVHAMASRKQVKLTEIIYSDNPSAIVDGELVNEGDTINGAKVIKIYRNMVEFEKDGEKWTQRVVTRMPGDG